MMTSKIEIMFHATFREITKKKKITEEVKEDSIVAEILDKLADRYGKDFKDIYDPKTGIISTEVLIMLNGRGIRAVNEKITDKDVLVITLPLGGG
ncbi:MAG: MoaD/ThiS family protein [Candidatus Hermodarchaeota archaeon]